MLKWYISVGDFENKFQFRPVQHFPFPVTYQHCTKTYPSKNGKVASRPTQQPPQIPTSLPAPLSQPPAAQPGHSYPSPSTPEHPSHPYYPNSQNSSSYLDPHSNSSYPQGGALHSKPQYSSLHHGSPSNSQPPSPQRNNTPHHPTWSPNNPRSIRLRRSPQEEYPPSQHSPFFLHGYNYGDTSA